MTWDVPVLPSSTQIFVRGYLKSQNNEPFYGFMEEGKSG